MNLNSNKIYLVAEIGCRRHAISITTCCSPPTMRASAESETHSKHVNLPTQAVNTFSGSRLPLLLSADRPHTLTLASRLQLASNVESALQNLTATTGPAHEPLQQQIPASCPLNNPCATATLPSLLPDATKPFASMSKHVTACVWNRWLQSTRKLPSDSMLAECTQPLSLPRTTEPAALPVLRELRQLQLQHAAEEASSIGCSCNCRQTLAALLFELCDSVAAPGELLTQHLRSPAAHEITALRGGFDEGSGGNKTSAASARTEDACCGCSTSLKCVSIAQEITRPSLVAENKWSSFQGLQHEHVT